MDDAGQVNVEALTPVAQDYIKAIWSAGEWGEPAITAKGLALRFGTSAANVTDTMRRLAAQGLLHYEPYRPVQLTDLGERLAVMMVRRHRLIETFLVTVLGYGWNEIHDEAERLEHAASEHLIERIDRILGHPVADPHGDPIPTADGRTRIAEGAHRLSDASAGRHRVVRVSDAEPENLESAERLGILPGTVIDVRVESGAVTVSTPAGPAPVPATLAASTWIITAEDRA